VREGDGSREGQLRPGGLQAVQHPLHLELVHCEPRLEPEADRARLADQVAEIRTTDRPDQRHGEDELVLDGRVDVEEVRQQGRGASEGGAGEEANDGRDGDPGSRLLLQAVGVLLDAGRVDSHSLDLPSAGAASDLRPSSPTLKRVLTRLLSGSASMYEEKAQPGSHIT
jgi:hypothetical protein